MSKYPKKNVFILGGGINGVSCAITILSQFHTNYRVTILAEKFSPETTGDGSGGLWMPYGAEPVDMVNRWANESAPIICAILQSHPELGCMTETDLYYKDYVPEDHTWTEYLTDYKEMPKESIPQGCNYGYTFFTPVVISWKYLKFLSSEADRLGAKFQRYKVTSVEKLNQDFPEADIFINCMGLGSREVFDDPDIVPGRGVIIKAQEKGVPCKKCIAFEDDPDGITYVISRDDCLVMGGTYNVGNWSTEPTKEEIDSIIKRCMRIAPELQIKSTEKVWVGLRPVRKPLRLELDTSYTKPVIHNYGHGGSGLTVHWGCAKAVLALLEEHCPTYKPSL